MLTLASRYSFSPASDVYVRSFLCFLYTLIKLYYTHTHTHTHTHTKSFSEASLLLDCKGTIAMPGGSDSKQYAHNAGDLGLIPRLGRSSGGQGGMATHSSILAWRIPRKDRAWWTVVHGVTESDTTVGLTFSFTGYRTCTGCMLKHLLFERAQIERLQEVRLSLGCGRKQRLRRNPELNREPLDFQSSALLTELFRAPDGSSLNVS